MRYIIGVSTVENNIQVYWRGSGKLYTYTTILSDTQTFDTAQDAEKEIQKLKSVGIKSEYELIEITEKELFTATLANK